MGLCWEVTYVCMLIMFLHNNGVLSHIAVDLIDLLNIFFLKTLADCLLSDY